MLSTGAGYSAAAAAAVGGWVEVQASAAAAVARALRAPLPAYCHASTVSCGDVTELLVAATSAPAAS